MDFFTGIVTVGVGHCHPRLIQAAIQKNEKILACICILFARSLLPTNNDKYVSVCLFVNSGSEANDLALHLAKEHTK
ncbi:unnamed protein product [Rotaria magnacalcarata]|uniref:Uncharacterized protein n=2 Tax=Rotaria magnacalcarata TaxID=392030 RepID=A0A815PG33_9BILA|nr:unnamed protein product [Rotaria magnacalcarata]